MRWWDDKIDHDDIVGNTVGETVEVHNVVNKSVPSFAGDSNGQII